jgi:D-alanyl-D-alanine carboxypeptidase (penicillin-binding protein 5/6)
VRTVSTNITGRSLYNTNEMLGYYPGTDGVKTGYTGQAGRCLVCSVTRDNWRIISVVLGCPTRTIRAESSRKILDYSFNNYKQYTLLKSNENIKNIRVIKGKSSNVPVVAADEIKLPLSHEELSALETEIELPDSFVAPVKGEIEVGNIRFVLDGKVIAESVLKTGNGVERKKVTDYLDELFGTWGKLMKLGTQWY